MTFGSDEVFLMIKQFIANPTGSSAYDELYVIVSRQGRNILYRSDRFRSILSEDDMDDVVQIVNMKVSQNLVDFYFRSLNATEAQRNAWLKKIVKNAAEDYVRKEKKGVVIGLDDAGRQIVSGEDPFDDPQDKLQSRSELLDAVAEICKLPTEAQRIIAFLLGKIGVSFAASRTSASAKEIILQLDGKTLFEAFETVRSLLFEIMEEPVSNDVFSGLIAKLNEHGDNGYVGDRRFDLHEKQISNAFGWFRDKLDDTKNIEDDDPNK